MGVLWGLVKGYNHKTVLRVALELVACGINPNTKHGHLAGLTLSVLTRTMPNPKYDHLHMRPISHG